MAKKKTTKKTTAEPGMYYAMLAPEFPITVMDLEECFTAGPSFGIADLGIAYPGLGLKLGPDPRASGETNENNFLSGPGIIFRTDASGNDIPITVDDIHLLQSLMVFKSTTLHAGKYNIPAIQMD